MVEQQYIKYLFEEEGKSLNEIKRMTGHNYRTVQRYASKEDWNEEERMEVKPENYPVLKDYIATIDEWLEADRKVPRKQRHTAKRVYDRLREEKGYSGSYGSVKRYVRKKKQLMKAVTEGLCRWHSRKDTPRRTSGSSSTMTQRGMTGKGTR